MPFSGYVEHYPLVRVRGGAALLLAALEGSLPPAAQAALRRVLCVIALMARAKVQRAAVLMFARRVLFPLLTGSFSTASGLPKAAKLSSSSATLIAELSHAAIVCSLAERLLKVDWRASLRFTEATAARSPSEEESLLRFLGAVVDSGAPSLPSAPLSVPLPYPIAAPPRRCSAFFSTTTPLALKAYLNYLHARPKSSPVAIFVPGLLTAPWTTHLIPIMRDFCRRQGTVVVGYDIRADAAHYDVDLRHMRKLIHQLRRREADSLASGAAPEAGVLVLASIRGRSVRNREKACILAKMHGWQVVELCVPTLPPDAVRGLEPQGRPQWVSARQSQCTMSSVRADLCLTAFDDAGMYGGAVVELCSADSALLMHMKRQCQPERAESRYNDRAWQAKARFSPHPAAPALRRRALLSSALTATLNAVSGTSELIAELWSRWVHRLCTAAWCEANMLRLGSAMLLETSAGLRRFPQQMLLSVPLYAQEQLRRLLAHCTRGVGPAANGSATRVASHSISASTSVEERTTYITAPLAAASLRAAPQSPATSPVDAYTDGGGGGSLTVAGSLSPSRAAAATLTAPEDEPTNSAVEWRIRLRWSWLLMLPIVAVGGAPQAASGAATTAHTSVEYVSLWSFVAQLPPWVVAVSAADDGETALGSRRSSCCVEAFATALLVRLAYPASPRAVAELLRTEARVEAAAVRPRTWDSFAAAPDTVGVEALKFEDAVLFPGCTEAARLGEELLYFPLSSSLPVSVRGAVLRVLWDKVPHAEDVDRASMQLRWLQGSRVASAVSDHVTATLNSIYQRHLASAQQRRDSSALHSGTDGRNTPPSVVAHGHSRAGRVSAQDAERVQRLLFDGASSSSAASSLSVRVALSSLTKNFISAVTSSL
ncbi:hypothetical protein LSCM1_02609 [Leishmania martiniquensis]|uniref:Uncharacterized protein n=1 Tax=Leishmania martiniquensis TaxID=1580590 RepID=A0A836FU66_9TRYP|nr:hypothetical protein LSCM1_02609 [Leishmania martiniquensis]